MSIQEEKAARLFAEKRLACVLQAPHAADACQPVMTNGASESLSLRRAVESDLLLAREGLEQLCQAIQGMSQDQCSLKTLASSSNVEAQQHALYKSTFGVRM